MTKAIAPARRNHRLNISLRSGVSSSATTTANPNTSMVCLLSMPMPARAPNHGHSRGSFRLMMRMTMSAQPPQTSGSIEFMER